MAKVGRTPVWQAPVYLTLDFPLNASIGDGPVFIADAPYEVVSVSEVHDTAGTDGGGVALDVLKSTGTQNTEAGATVLATTFNLKSTPATVVQKTRSNGGLAASRSACQLAKGDRLGLDYDGTLTSLAGHVVVIVLQPIIRKPVW